MSFYFVYFDYYTKNNNMNETKENTSFVSLKALESTTLA